jgi:hypothetical protein
MKLTSTEVKTNTGFHYRYHAPSFTPTDEHTQNKYRRKIAFTWRHEVLKLKLQTGCFYLQLFIYLYYCTPLSRILPGLAREKRVTDPTD